MQCDLSPTFQSNALHTPLDVSRITINDPQYSRYLSASQRDKGKKWGRHWSYGGIGPFVLADFSQFDPYGQPVPAGKGHKHWGSGLHPYPRGVPIEQFYKLTDLKLSKLRWNDELVPRSLSTNVSKEQLSAAFPADHPMHSHTVQHSVFPDIEISPEGVLADDDFADTQASAGESAGMPRAPSSRPRSAAQKAREGQAMHIPRSGKVTVISKTRGASARHEKIIALTGNEEELVNSQRPLMHDVWDTARSQPHKRALTYPAPRVTHSARPEQREDLMVRPRTARLLENMQTKTCYKTTYQQQHTERGVQHIDNIDDYEHEQEKAQLASEFPEDTGSIGSDDESARAFRRERSAGTRKFLPPASAVSRKMQTADLGGDGYCTGYHVPKPREGRHSRAAASLLHVRDTAADDEYGELDIDGTCRPGTARARSAGIRFGEQTREAGGTKERLRPGTPWVRRPGTGRYRPQSDSEDTDKEENEQSDEEDWQTNESESTPRSVKISTAPPSVHDDGSSSASSSTSKLSGTPTRYRPLSSANTAKAVTDDFGDGWRPGSGYPRPRSSFHEREATFSKSVMHQQLHQDFPEKAPDLRQYAVLPGRKRYIIHGSHGYWFHHG